MSQEHDILAPSAPSEAVPPEPAPLPPAAPPAAPPPDRTLASRIAWGLAIAFILLEGIWAAKVGLDIRRTLWQNTRTIHFYSDVANAIRFGNGALRAGERQAGLAMYGDVEAAQTGDQVDAIRQTAIDRGRDTSQPIRRMTWPEVLNGIVHYYDDLYNGLSESGQEFDGLDYPPVRLLVATIWARHTETNDPTLLEYPRDSLRQDTPEPQKEDITLPMLNLNTVCEAASALLMFALVWLWTVRGQTGLAKVRPGFPICLIAFILVTAVFWHRLTTLAAWPVRPTPIVNLTRVTAVEKAGSVTATIYGVVNGQQTPTRWRIEYGPTESYGSFSPFRSVLTGGGPRDVPVSMPLTKLKPGQVVHLRLIATSLAGTSKTPDAFFKPGTGRKNIPTPPVGGVIWPAWPAWMGELGLFVAMVILARRLPGLHQAWACGLVAALLVWFDPINLVDSHVWPQWDVWILPMFIGAALLASLDWWMTAGMLIGIGCMAKGQLLFAGPVLILWPIVGGRFAAAARIIIGFALSAGAIVSPWIVNSPDERHWIECFGAVCLIYSAVIFFGKRNWPKISMKLAAQTEALDWLATRRGGFLVAGASILITFFLFDLHNQNLAIHLVLLAALAIPWLIKRRRIPYWLAGMAAAALWSGALLFSADFNWWRLGFAYGTRKHDRMQMGEMSFANFPSLLLNRYNWDLHQLVGNLAVSIHFPDWNILGLKLAHLNFDWNQDLDLKIVMATVYGLTLLLCALAASVHSRRRDPRVLVALTAPWILFPILMCQTTERYLLWPSCLSAAMLAVSTGMSLLHVLLALVGGGMIIHQLMMQDQGRWPMLYKFFSSLYPDSGWMMLLLALTFLIAAFVPTRGRGPGGLLEEAI